MQINNYQAIIVTDGVSAFAVFNYICGELQWSGIGTNQAAVVGFNAEGTFYGNHPLSGFSSIGESVSCPTSSSGGRRKRQQDGQDDMTNMFMALPVNMELNQMRMSCAQHKSEDEELFVTLNEIPVLAAMLGADHACPCTQKQARRDTNFIIFPDASGCYLSIGPVIIPPNSTIRNVQLELTQQCCYDIRGYVSYDYSDNFNS